MATREETAGAPSGKGGLDDRALYLDLYRQMVFIRRFEELVQSLYLRGQVYGSTHLCIGQEAVSAGVCTLVREQDWVAATYRGHGHTLALGMSPVGILGELMGRTVGTCGGRAGSMNIVDLDHRLIGCFGIVGGSLAAATGAGLTLKLSRTGGAAIGLFGDGAANQAYFLECLNFAKVNELPVLYVCENNQYGEFTPMEKVTAGGILPRPRALDIPSERVDGNDVWAVREAVQRALEEARSGGGPSFIEALTYRYSDHGRGDPVQYRPPGEMEAWRARDPIDVAAARLREDYGATAEELAALGEDAEAELERTKQTALAASFPEPDVDATEFKGETVKMAT